MNFHLSIATNGIKNSIGAIQKKKMINIYTNTTIDRQKKREKLLPQHRGYNQRNQFVGYNQKYTKKL